jgi:hypothetical protein
MSPTAYTRAILGAVADLVEEAKDEIGQALSGCGCEAAVEAAVEVAVEVAFMYARMLMILGESLVAKLKTWSVYSTPSRSPS